jgi:hypothetical protein
MVEAYVDDSAVPCRVSAPSIEKTVVEHDCRQTLSFRTISVSNQTT